MQQQRGEAWKPASGTFLLAIMATRLCKRDRRLQSSPSKTRILVLKLVSSVMGTSWISLFPLASLLIGRRSFLGIEVNRGSYLVWIMAGLNSLRATI